ncbi:MAG: hypothetical protein OHK0012_07280 [Synechococcales cyanobacterium]
MGGVMNSQRSTAWVLASLGLWSVATSLPVVPEQMASVALQMPIPTPPPILPSPTPTPTATPAFIPSSGGHDLSRAALSAYVYGLTSQGSPLTDEQVILVDAQGQVLAEHQMTQGMTTVGWERVLKAALLRCGWGDDHRFATRVYSTGSLNQGTLDGDLWIVGDQDPYFTIRDGQDVARRLNQVGIRRISGSLNISESFWMQGQSHAQVAGHLLQLSFDPTRWATPDLKPSVRPRRPNGYSLPMVSVGTVQVVQEHALPPEAALLLTHWSRPMSALSSAAVEDSDFLFPDSLSIPSSLSRTQVIGLLSSPSLAALIPDSHASDPETSTAWISEMPLDVRWVQTTAGSSTVTLGLFPDGRRWLVRSQAQDPSLLTTLVRDLR